MTLPFGRQYGLVPRGGPGLTCDEEGLALGSIALAIITEDRGGRRLCRLRSVAEIEKALDLAYGSRLDRPVGRYCSGFQRIAEPIESGDRGRADLHAVLLGLPPIPADGMAKLAGAGDLNKAGDAWQGESRVSAGEDGAGEWTEGGGEAAHLFPAASQTAAIVATPAQRAAFVYVHLAAATRAAKALGVPVENVLGLAALESGWGMSRFAKEGRNLFNMYYPAPQSKAMLPAKDNKNSHVACYDNAEQSFQSFATKYKMLVQGVNDPEIFATVLQNKARFGVSTKTGKNDPRFVPSVVKTIRSMRSRLAGLSV